MSDFFLKNIYRDNKSKKNKPSYVPNIKKVTMKKVKKFIKTVKINIQHEERIDELLKKSKNKFKLKKHYFLKSDKHMIDYNKLILTDIGEYSISKSFVSQKFIKIFKSTIKRDLSDCIITDGTGGMGGDTIVFVNYFKCVNICDNSFDHILSIFNNIREYNYLDKVKIYYKNYLEALKYLKQDIIYLDPPWGGPKYKNKNKIMLYLDDVPLYDVIKIIKKTRYFFIKIPTNFNKKKFSDNINLNNYSLKYFNITKSVNLLSIIKL